MFQSPDTELVTTPTMISWRTHPGAVTPTPEATLAFVSAPGGGTVDVASDPFTLSANGNTKGDVIFTPYIVSGPGGGTFTPTTKTINSAGTPSGDFTFTASAVGSYMIGISNNRGLTNPAPVPYSSQAAYVSLDLSQAWLGDIHPKRSLLVTQGTIPSGVAGKAGNENKITLSAEHAYDPSLSDPTKAAVVTRRLGTDTSGVTADYWNRPENIATYKQFEIITDPLNASRKLYRQYTSQSGSGWLNNHKKMRASIGWRGTDIMVPYGERCWLVHEVRIPAYWKGAAAPKGNDDWLTLLDYHANAGVVMTGKAHFQTEFQAGGAAPATSRFIMRVNVWSQPTWPSGTGTVANTVYPLLVDPPADTPLYFVCYFRMWPGFPDPSSNPIATPDVSPTEKTIKMYVAVGDSGSAAQVAEHTGYFGFPYKANEPNWATPGYHQGQMYCNPTYTPAGAGLDRGVDSQGMMLFRESDNPDPVGHPTGYTAQDILAAFKASRLVTPPP